MKPGRILKSVPKIMKNIYHNFLDERGRIILSIDMESFPHVVNRSLYRYEDDYILRFIYNSGCLIAAQIFISEQNVLLAKGRRNTYKYEYFYSKNVLLNMKRYQAYGTPNEIIDNYTFEYKDDQLIRICRHCSNGYSEYVYKK